MNCAEHSQNNKPIPSYLPLSDRTWAGRLQPDCNPTPWHWPVRTDTGSDIHRSGPYKTLRCRRRFGLRLHGPKPDIWKLCRGRNWMNFMEESGAIYVTCFCEEGDLLSQWRGYAAGVGGFALGFRVAEEDFDPGVDTELDMLGGTTSRVRLIKVAYSHEAQQTLVDNVVDRMGATGEEPALQELFELHVSLKNPAFAEEDEWRLITFRKDESDIRVRPTDELLVPYVSLRRVRPTSAPTPDGDATTEADDAQAQGDNTTPQTDDAPAQGDDITAPAANGPDHEDARTQTDNARAEAKESALPLREIVIGPTPNPELAVKAVRIALSNNDYPSSVRIVHSEVPLRKT